MTKERVSARVLLMHQDRLLLLRAHDPAISLPNGTAHPPFWFTVGGGREPGESLQDCALRETLEETGLLPQQVQIGAKLWQGVHTMIFNGETVRITNHYFLGASTSMACNFAHLTASERGVLTDHRWFTRAELLAWPEMIYPKNLTELLTSHSVPI